MNDNELLGRVIEEVEYLLARRKWKAQEHPRLVVVHGHHQPETVCRPGETIDRCYLQFHDRDIPILLAQPGLMLCDCMVRHHDTPLSIARIERILGKDPFYRRLGAHSFEGITEAPHFTRVSLRVYIVRLREQIVRALRKGGSALSQKDALASDTTDSNMVVHRINLPVAIIHRTTTSV